MSNSRNTQRDKTTPVDYAQQALIDGLDAVRRPDAHAVMLLDLTAAHAFREQYKKETGVALTDLHLIIRAAARTLEAKDGQSASPLNSILHGNRIIEPASIDIGVSVTSRRTVAPVVVLPRVETKSLSQIREELTAKADEAAIRQQAQFATFNRYARLIPSRIVRRQFVRLAMHRHQVRRAMLGTMQITTIDLPDLEYYLPAHIGTTMLVSIGGVKLRPLVVDGRVEARPSAYFAFQVDQRIVNPVNALRVFRRFKRWMEQPGRLDENLDGQK